MGLMGLMTEAFTRAECLNAVANLMLRQREILVKIGHCKPRKIIADDLGISYSTVRTHCQTMYRLLGINSDNEAVRIACKAGLA